MLGVNVRRAALRSSFKGAALRSSRCLSTLERNPHIYVFGDETQAADSTSSPASSAPQRYLLTLLPTRPPTAALAVGHTPTVPPTPTSLTASPRFLALLDEVLAAHAPHDPGVQSQAAAFASSSATTAFLGGGQARRRGQQEGASGQGGAGGGGRGGWLHVSDSRAPPDYGRIAWPEDIFGSLEVDGAGAFVEGGRGLGNWQSSGTYRIVTREGILGLSDFLRGKLVERLLEEEEKKERMD